MTSTEYKFENCDIIRRDNMVQHLDGREKSVYYVFHPLLKKGLHALYEHDAYNIAKLLELEYRMQTITGGLI